ncbi:hypothetical protein AUJ46_02315 [Candidatus Peregrinibacteria bacterium CG1_02_54_53]|nr:MAG: hypothetical protein AUJ46_02315 [Candidatus Peregrinibacteria bacterium CG1_02_54_53]
MSFLDLFGTQAIEQMGNAQKDNSKTSSEEHQGRGKPLPVQRTTRRKKDATGEKRITGWLLFLGISLGLGSLSVITWILSALALDDTSTLLPLVALDAPVIILFWLFVRRDFRFPIAFKIIFSLRIGILFLFLVYPLGTTNPQKTLAFIVIQGIWVAYVAQSKKVRAVFGNKQASSASAVPPPPTKKMPQSQEEQTVISSFEGHGRNTGIQYVGLFLTDAARLIRTYWYKVTQSAPQEVKAVIGVLDEASLIFRENISFPMVKDCIKHLIYSRPHELAQIIRDGTPPRKWVYVSVANISGDFVSCGEFHVYRGVLNFMGTDLLKLFDAVLDELVKMGFLGAEIAQEQKATIRENIRNVG